MDKLERSGYGMVRDSEDWYEPRISLWVHLRDGLAMLLAIVAWYFLILLITP